MKIDVIKEPGGIFRAASDMDFESTTGFKTGEMYTIEIKNSRNPQHHRKGMAFLRYCFEHWAGGHEFQDESTQFDSFRKQLTISAGYYEQVFSINKADFVLEAKSLSFNAMAQDEFEDCYQALIQAAMSNIFNTADEQTLNRLMGFF